MSRKTMLSRVSHWLTQLVNVRSETKSDSQRKPRRSFGFHRLEDRIVLDASFSIDLDGNALEFNASDFGNATNLTVDFVSFDINGDGNEQQAVKLELQGEESWNTTGTLVDRFKGTELASSGSSLWISRDLLSLTEVDGETLSSSVLAINGTSDLDVVIVSLESFGAQQGILSIENAGDISQSETGNGIQADLLKFDNVGNVNLMNANNDIVCLCGNIEGNLTIQDNNGLTITDEVNISATSGTNRIQSNSPLIINSDITSSTDLTLVAGNDSGATGDDLVVRNNAVVTINSTINRILRIQAGDNVILGDASGGGSTGTLRTIGGGVHTIIVEAARDGDADGVNGSVIQAFGTQDAISTDTLSITAGDGIGTGGFTPAGTNELNLKLIGQTGSNVVSYIASGSVTLGNATVSVSSGLGLAPNTGVWTSSFDNNLGDFLKDSMNTSLNDDLALSNGGVSYLKNGTQFGVLDTIDLDGSTGSGGDDIELDPTTTINYPSLIIGDVLSWSGSGTFTLEDSETFDTLFVATGTFSNAIDGGNFVVEVIDSAGQGGLLMTSVSTMTLAIDGPDGINIENQKSGAELVITGINDSGGGGDVSIENNSPLRVSGAINVAGNLNLTAGDSGAAGDDLIIDNDSMVTLNSAVDGKVMTLTAGDNVVFGNSVGSTTGAARTIGGNHSIIITANNDGAADGDIGKVTQEFGLNQALITDNLTIDSGGKIGGSGAQDLLTNVSDLTVISSTGIDIDNASPDLTLSSVVSTGNISITTAGALTAGDVGTNGVVTLDAAGSISDDGNSATKVSGFSLVADAGGSIVLETAVADIVASTSAAGNITITEMDSILLIDIDTFDGQIDISAAGDIVATDVVSGDDGNDADHKIDLDASAGSLSFGAVTSDGDVILNAAGAILNDGNASTKISGNKLTADAGGGIDLDTAVTEIDASTSAAGNITISEMDGVDLVDIDTFDGQIDISAAGNIVATDVVSGDDGNDADHKIDLDASAGSLTFGAVTSDGDVVLNASGAILNDGNAGTKVSGNKLTADAGGGIDLDTAVTEIDASTSAAGNIQINEMDSVTLVDIDTFDGQIDISAAGNILATDVASGDDGDDADHKIDLDASAGNLNFGVLNSDGDVVLNATGTILGGSNATSKVSGNRLTADAGGVINIDTDVTEIDASTSAAGNITINELDGVDLVDIDTFDGPINVIAGGTIVASDVASGDDNNDENNVVNLRTNAGDVQLNQVSSDHDLRVIAPNDITDSAGSQITTGRNFILDAGRNIKIGDEATDSINVNVFFSVRSRANADDAEIRVGVSNDVGLSRGTDSGAEVTAKRFRFRSINSAFSNTGETSVNFDSAIIVVSTNNVNSLMLRAEGMISDIANAQIRIKETASFLATDGVDFFDVALGDSFGTNVLTFRSLSVLGDNVSIERDGRILLDGVKAMGNLTLGTTSNIRQSGIDRFDAIGTSFVEVSGDAEFVLDNAGTSSGDVKLVSNTDKLLMDNLFDGQVTVTTTGFTGQRNGTGEVRDIEIRNSSNTPTDLNYQLEAADQVRNLLVWSPNSSFEFSQSVDVSGSAKVFVGVDSETIDGTTGNRVRGGKLEITDAGSIRSLTDAAGFGLMANDTSFIVANSILLADDATDTFEVTNLSSFTILQDSADSSIQVGVDPGGIRGTDSGALFTTDLLRFRAPVGDNGVVTILVDSDFTILPESNAGDALVEMS